MKGIQYGKRSFTAVAILLVMLTGLSVSWYNPRPKIFLLGDSISIHYGPYLKNYLQPVADLEQKKIETINGKEFSRNGGDSRRVLTYLTAKLNGFKPDYIILNCGLHDIGRDSATNNMKVPLTEYGENLDKIFSMLAKQKINTIWITTTPVVDSLHNSRTKAAKRFAADLSAYSLVAAAACKKYNIPVVDLHSFTATLGPTAYIDNVHYKEDVRNLQAAFIAGAVNNILDKTLSK